jgi:hypothetical protein
MSCLKHLRFVKAQTVWMFALSFILTCVFSLTPVWAQANSTAAITLDGRRLFEVSQLEGFDAQPRADYANQILNRAVASGEPATVQVVKIISQPAPHVFFIGYGDSALSGRIISDRSLLHRLQRMRSRQSQLAVGLKPSVTLTVLFLRLVVALTLREAAARL